MNTYRHSILEIQHEKLGRSLYISLLTHLFLGVLFFILPSYINPSHDPWGSSKTGGGAIPVGLVNQSAIRGLKLPRPALTTSSNVSTDSKGLGKTQEIKPSTPETEINLPFITAVDGSPQHLVEKFTGSEFDKITKDLVEKTREPVLKALEDLSLIHI